MFFMPAVSSCVHLNESLRQIMNTDNANQAQNTRNLFGNQVRDLILRTYKVKRVRHTTSASLPRSIFARRTTIARVTTLADDRVGCNRDYVATSTSDDEENAGREKQFMKRVKGKCKNEK